jgi:hypothetical protein
MSQALGLTRRNVLKYLGGTTIVGGASVGSARTPHKKEIITLRSDEGIEATRKVPTDWYHQNKRARRAAKQVTAELKNTPGVVTVSSKRSKDTLHGQRKSHVEVRVDTERFSGKQPENNENIPVRFVSDTEVSTLGGTGGW